VSQIGFWNTAQSRAEGTAVVDDSGKEISFSGLFANQNRLANGLRALGLGVGDCVAALLWNQRESLEVALATAQTGLYVLPLNWHLTAPEVAHILADSGAAALVADDRMGPVAVRAADGATLDHTRRLAVGAIAGFTSYEEFISRHSAARPTSPTAGQTMLYTSGTTGRPKGIRRRLSGADPEAAVAPMVAFLAQVMGVPSGEGVQLVTGPLYHTTPGTLAMLGLHMGHTLVLMDKWEPKRTLELVERYQVSYMHMVPTMFQRLLELPDDVKRRYDTSSLRSVVHGAAPCPMDVKMRMIDWFGPIIREYYGSSEGGGASVNTEDWLKRPGTVGLPWPGATIRIYDDDGTECAPNQVGQVYIKTPGFEFEYHNAPEKTRDSTRDGFFTVGDVGYLDEDGYLFLSGRSTELIIAGGVNIYPAEVEGCLAAHPAVADVGVIGVPNQEWGEEVKAVVKLRDGVEPSAELADQLIAHCRDSLARFKVPRTVDFRATLPRTDTGKLHKRLLREEYWAAAGQNL
jgi:long-chain acyl-CoA synthetase